MLSSDLAPVALRSSWERAEPLIIAVLLPIVAAGDGDGNVEQGFEYRRDGEDVYNRGVGKATSGKEGALDHHRDFQR